MVVGLIVLVADSVSVAEVAVCDFALISGVRCSWAD